MHITRLLLAAWLAALLPGQAQAEHEADHRYALRGFVLDANEDGLGGVAVTVRLGDQTVARARTDGQGYYSARAHLHDSDIGRTLTIRAGERTARVKMTAVRGDQATARVHHVNFVGDRVVEGELGGLRFPAWVYTAAAAGGGLLVAGFVAHRVSRARRRERKRAEAQAKPRSQGRRRRKRRA